MIQTTHDTDLVIQLEKIFDERLVFTTTAGWVEYDDHTGLWEVAPHERVLKLISDHLRTFFSVAVAEAATPDEAKARYGGLKSLLSAGKAKGLMDLLAGNLLGSEEDFDSEPHLLHCANGVVDLTTKALSSHSPTYRCTRTTNTNFVSGATHPAWNKALEAVDPSIRKWLQQRFGQAAVGTISPLDVLMLFVGAGSNGKTALLGAIQGALGTYAILMDERVLMAATSSGSSTETTVLKGARLGYIEETAAGGHLDMNRVKKLVETPKITARRLYKDPMTWDATHSLIVTTNNLPIVTDTDHGAWRRVALVKFPYTFPPSDFGKNLKASDVLEAVLSWIIDGAHDVLSTPLAIPQQVVDDTAAWREMTDPILNFTTSRLEPDPDSSVLTSEMFSEFNRHQTQIGQAHWTERNFTPKFGSHDAVTKQGIAKVERTRKPGPLSRPYGFDGAPVPDQATIWRGVKFKDDSDEQIFASFFDWKSAIEQYERWELDQGPNPEEGVPASFPTNQDPETNGK